MQVPDPNSQHKHGGIELRIAKVRDKNTRVFSPLPEVREIPKRRIVLEDMSFESIGQIHKA
jgi:hypothetical protein